jgi:hypothetical protein
MRAQWFFIGFGTGVTFVSLVILALCLGYNDTSSPNSEPLDLHQTH